MTDYKAKTNILIVEDEKGIQELIKFTLNKEGYNVQVTSNGKEALDILKQKLPDLIILDLMLPDIDGFELFKIFKNDPSTNEIPIVMVTAKNDESDIYAGLTLGADDYITKPFSPKILGARVKTILRRKEKMVLANENILEHKNLRIDKDQRKVFVDGKDTNLTYLEFLLINVLANKPGRVFSRGQIVESIHNEETSVTDRSIDNLIVGLRKKLGSCSNYIETAWGTGYCFKLLSE